MNGLKINQERRLEKFKEKMEKNSMKLRKSMLMTRELRGLELRI